MKVIYSFTLLTILLSSAFTSRAQLRETSVLDTQVERMLDSAAKHMVIFILSQDEIEYFKAMERIHKANEINGTLVIKSEKLKGYHKKIQDYVTEDRVEEFNYYNNEELKSMILNEPLDHRTIKVRFRGKMYKLSNDSKKLYEEFITYLPRN